MSERDRRNSYQNRGGGNRDQSRSPHSSRGYQGSRKGSRRKSNRGERKYLPRNSVVYVLDLLKHGGVDTPGHSWNPVCQVIEMSYFHLYEVDLNKGEMVNLQDKMVISDNSPFGRIKRVMKYEDLTPTSKDMLEAVLKSFVLENEERFIKFINNAGPITIKRHSLEVLPGVGKKLMWEIVNSREKAAFSSFADLHVRVPGFKPTEVIVKRIVEEIENSDEKHYLFVRKRKPTSTSNANRNNSSQGRSSSYRKPY